MDRVKRGKSEEYALTEDQLQSLWNQCREIEDKILIGLMAFCGMRVSEAIHLKAIWIKEDSINIPSQMACSCWDCKAKGIWTPKSKAGIRSIPVPGFLHPHLSEYLGKRPGGLAITRQSAWNHVKHLASQAGIAYLFPHALRASYATILASKGLEAATICYTLGWSRLEVAQSYVRIARAKQLAQTQIKKIWG